jgi:hypothetical protein
LVPVGFRLHADPFHGGELALDAEQLLDDALGLLVASFAEVLVADAPACVDEVERRPVVVVECAPDRVVAVERNRVVNRPILIRLPYSGRSLARRRPSVRGTGLIVVRRRFVAI